MLTQGHSGSVANKVYAAGKNLMELFAVYTMPCPLQRKATESKLVHFSMTRMFLQRVFISEQYFFEMETLHASRT